MLTERKTYAPPEKKYISLKKPYGKPAPQSKEPAEYDRAGYKVKNHRDFTKKELNALTNLDIGDGNDTDSTVEIFDTNEHTLEESDGD